VDTVTDADKKPRSGNGFVSHSVDTAGVVDALHRAVRAWRITKRRRRIQLRGMNTDWSWKTPARHHIELYKEIVIRNT
jgi:glycogen synthase